MDKLYIITRRDLTAGQQIAQAAHAMAEIACELPQFIEEWHKESQYIVVLSVKDEKELTQLFNTLGYDGIIPFYEPDLNNQLTAIAISPHHYEDIHEELAHLPLALKEFKT